MRFRHTGSEPTWGVNLDGHVHTIEGDPLAECRPGERVASLDEVQLLAPCTPTKIVCVAINYEGIDGFSAEMLEPLIFIKPASSVIGPNAVITNPFPGSPWWGEAELGVVIKKRACEVSIDQVDEYVLGLTIGNDVTVENCDGRDHHLVRSKGADGFCPLGPWIETEFPRHSLRIRAIQDGECIREGWSHQQFWEWPEILTKISSWMTLEPYDVILTGNVPDTVGMRYLGANAVFDAEVTGIGSLRTVFRDS